MDDTTEFTLTEIFLCGKSWDGIHCFRRNGGRQRTKEKKKTHFPEVVRAFLGSIDEWCKQIIAEFWPMSFVEMTKSKSIRCCEWYHWVNRGETRGTDHHLLRIWVKVCYPLAEYPVIFFFFLRNLEIQFVSSHFGPYCRISFLLSFIGRP